MLMATAQKKWTREELHSLPDDGNTYELIRGELFVTPAPTFDHGLIAARLNRQLVAYVTHEIVGYVFHPRASFTFEDSEVEPDLQLYQVPQDADGSDLAAEATLLLVIEIASPSTRKRDREQKRSFYMDAGIPEYWIVDGDKRTITVVKSGASDVTVTENMSWHPDGTSKPLQFNVNDVFGTKRT